MSVKKVDRFQKGEDPEKMNGAQHLQRKPALSTLIQIKSGEREECGFNDKG